MARVKAPLAARYGTLKVLDAFTVHGLRVVRVECDCGVKKEVVATSLIRGATKSCGTATCRPGGRVTPDQKFHPFGVRFATLKELERMWELYTGTPRVTGTDIAVKFKVNPNTLYSAFRAIGKSGGFSAYRSMVEREVV